ncbi:MAG: helix-turn-helix transcriptional regulator [Brasilonema angustatum HA4187-MV1]|jgi:transcriptional regulator with XRE-family HTH domain|nr:helix-turn-helix transcriptional regulator [Brasilonema angustatum HA4187-MV1]
MKLTKPRDPAFEGSEKIISIVRELKGRESAADFSRRLGIRGTTLGRVLRGEALPTLQVLSVIAQNSPYTIGQLAAIACNEPVEDIVVAQNPTQALKLISHFDNNQLVELMEMIFEKQIAKNNRKGVLLKLLSVLAG